jgi:hypothetical protein
MTCVSCGATDSASPSGSSRADRATAAESAPAHDGPDRPTISNSQESLRSSATTPGRGYDLGDTLLTLGDLPKGFSAARDENMTSSGNCTSGGNVFAVPEKRTAMFENSAGASLVVIRNIVVRRKDADAAIAELKAMLDGCQRFVETSDYGTTKTYGTLARHDAPAFGDDTLAYEFEATSGGLRTTGLLTFVRVGSAITSVTSLTTDVKPTELAVDLAGVAARRVSKLEGGS